MTPGTTTLRICSHCKGQISDYSCGSGNNFGARYWTDGKCEAPMLPDEPDLVKCPHCLKLIWITEQPEFDERDVSLPDTETQSPEAPDPLLPDLADYEKLLSRRIRSKSKELDARIRAWWKGNDPHRQSERSVPLTAFEAGNLQSLIALLQDHSEDDAVMKAEAYRELGEFDAAVRLLSDRPRRSPAAPFILDLAVQRVSAVCILPKF